MKVAVCVRCGEIVAAGGWNPAFSASHRKKDGIHPARTVEIPEDPQAIGETPEAYHKRLAKSHGKALFG